MVLLLGKHVCGTFICTLEGRAEKWFGFSSVEWDPLLCSHATIWAWGQPRPSAWQILCCHQACIFTNVVVCGPILSSKIYPFFIGNINESKWCCCFAPWVLKFNRALPQQLEGCWPTPRVSGAVGLGPWESAVPAIPGDTEAAAPRATRVGPLTSPPLYRRAVGWVIMRQWVFLRDPLESSHLITPQTE